MYGRGACTVEGTIYTVNRLNTHYDRTSRKLHYRNVTTVYTIYYLAILKKLVRVYKILDRIINITTIYIIYTYIAVCYESFASTLRNG